MNYLRKIQHPSTATHSHGTKNTVNSSTHCWLIGVLCPFIYLFVTRTRHTFTHSCPYFRSLITLSIDHKTAKKVKQYTSSLFGSGNTPLGRLTGVLFLLLCRQFEWTKNTYASYDVWLASAIVPHARVSPMVVHVQKLIVNPPPP